MAETYVKKPVEVEAMQWDGTAESATRIIDWILDNGGTATYICSNPDRCAENDGDTPHTIDIPTLEGVMSTSLNDWVIKEPFPTDDRKFYPCKPSMFENTYQVKAKSPVQALYESWVKAGPPPLGSSMAPWWDKKLLELRRAIDG